MSARGEVSADEPSILERHIAARVKKLKLKNGASFPLPLLIKEMVRASCRTTCDEFYTLSFEDEKIHSIQNTPCELCAAPYYYHRPTVPCELSFQAATEYAATKVDFKHPTRCADCGVLLSMHQEGEVEDSETGDPIEEEEEIAAVKEFLSFTLHFFFFLGVYPFHYYSTHKFADVVYMSSILR